MSHAPAPAASEVTPRVLAALLAVYLIWGSTYYAIHVTLQDLTPFLMASSRFLIAGAVLFGFAAWRGGALPSALQWRNAAIIGGLLLLIGHGGVVFAQQWVPSSLAALAVASMPIWATVIAWLSGRKSTRFDLIGIAAGFVGVVLLNLDGGILGAGIGAIALFVAPIAWAWGSMLAWVWQIVGGSIVAYTAYLYLLEKVRPALATSYAFVNPVIAVLLGVGLGGELLDPWGWAGTVVIVVAVALITLTKR